MTMARFRKGTNDADGNGSKGGSLKRGSRFVKGTNDADNDGHKGGSLKGDDMVKKAKAEPKAEAPLEAKADKMPEAQPKLADRKKAAEELFQTADEQAAADSRMRLAVRGF